MNKIGIIETDIFGVKAYHARCFDCKWKSKRYDKEKQAVKAARKHGEGHIIKRKRT